MVNKLIPAGQAQHVFVSAEHGAFSPDGKVSEVTAEEVQAINAAGNAKELAYWAGQPATFAPGYFSFPQEETDGKLYRREFSPLLTGAKVSTWNGSVIGHVISAKVFSHNFGGRFVALTMRGTNGAEYYGRASWDHGTVIRLRIKSSKRTGKGTV